MKDLIIKNGTIINAKEIMRADILISNEKIAQIDLLINRPNTDYIDAEGRFIFPGIIDAHVHLEETFPNNIENADDFESGTRAAASGGITTIIDFTSPQFRNESLIEAYKRRRNQADSKVVIDYALHGCIPGGVSLENLAEMETLKEAGISSYKLFTIGDDLGLTNDEIVSVMEKAAELDVMVDVHAEDSDIIRDLEQQLVMQGKTSAHHFPESRPNFTEANVVRELIRINSGLEGRLYFVHLSTKEAVSELDGNIFGNGSVFGETCPQYLLLNDDVYSKENAEQYLIVPPLRKDSDRGFLWKALNNGTISVIGTDHCPFYIHQKAGEKDFRKIPKGIGSVELLLPLMYSEGVVKQRISMNRMVELISSNPARIFGLSPQKGTIDVGSDADLVIFNPEKEWQVNSKELKGRSDFSVYNGWEITGQVEMTLSRGEIIYQNGMSLGKPGHGKYLFRK